MLRAFRNLALKQIVLSSRISFLDRNLTSWWGCMLDHEKESFLQDLAEVCELLEK